MAQVDHRRDRVCEDQVRVALGALRISEPAEGGLTALADRSFPLLPRQGIGADLRADEGLGRMDYIFFAGFHMAKFAPVGSWITLIQP